MDSNFDVNATRLLETASDIGSQLTDGYGPVLLGGAAVPLFVAVKGADYKRRRREERIWTGAVGSVTKAAQLALPKGIRAHELNPALPAVFVRKIPKPHRSIASTRNLWWTPCGEYDEPQMLVAAMTDAYKNQSVFDGTCWHVLRYRKESAVLMDVKGDGVGKFAPRIAGGQWIFTFLEEHDRSSAINLIETPEWPPRPPRPSTRSNTPRYPPSAWAPGTSLRVSPRRSAIRRAT